MTSARKRVRLSAVTPPPAVTGCGSTHTPHSHHALLPSPVRGEEEEEEGGYLVVEEKGTDSNLIITTENSQVKVKKRKVAKKKKREPTEGGMGGESEEEGVGVEIDTQLDQSLESKSKQHNLTTVNVRNIIHEVITNEHVVAMMKAAMNETGAVPPFEPKMTRSKLKEVAQKGVVIPTWTISPIKSSSDGNKPPQFVDIPLAEEDSSDEEYYPDEEDEDETAEDTFHESDMESSASSPRGSRLTRAEEDSCSPWQTSRGRAERLRAGPVSMGPPPPPKTPPPKVVTDSTFLEELHAVEEELAVCMEPFQPLSESEDESSLMAYRTRSKRPLRDIPLGRLEAELRAPDITPDMYDSSSAHEDRDWTDWLRGLMTSDVDQEEECDDEDDPEYNFLADVDEPDQEDYRDDKAVRITKKEVNELMEELFETLKEDLAGQEVDDEGHEEEEELRHVAPSAHIAPGDGPITELRTVKQQLDFMRRKHTHNVAHRPEPHTLTLDTQQKRQLQRQLEQHVQLLTQTHLLTSPVVKLQSEAETTRQFLVELDLLAQRAELIFSVTRPAFRSAFRTTNLQGALRLLEELLQHPVRYQTPTRPPDARGYIRSFPVLPAELAWIFATRPVFLHPELLPCASLDPALYCPRRTAAFTAAEDCLLVLGLRNMEGSCDPPKLVSQFLLRKTLVQVRRRILQCCRPGFPDNVVKAFRYQRVLWPMPVVCRCVEPLEGRPPVEREECQLPLWLLRSLPVLHHALHRYNDGPPGSAPKPSPLSRRGGARQSHLTFLRSASRRCRLPPGSRYPARLPDHLDFRRIGFILLHRPLPPPGAAVTVATCHAIPRRRETLTGLKGRREEAVPLNEELVRKEVEEEEEEEGHVVLALSESSGDEGETEEVRRSGASGQSGAELHEDEDRRKSVVPVLSRDLLHRVGAQGGSISRGGCHRKSATAVLPAQVCEALQVGPDVEEQVLRVLDAFSGGGGSVQGVFHRLRQTLQPWPPPSGHFAAFLTHGQARCCGMEMFEHGRRFLLRLGQNLGKSSKVYQQVVSFLQRSPSPSSKDFQQVSILLRRNPHLQRDVQLLFQQFHPPSAVMATNSQTDPASHNPPHHSLQMEEQREGGEEEQREGGEEEQREGGEEEQREGEVTEEGEQEREEEKVTCARNISELPTREKVTTWTRDDDRAILTSCQQRGANQQTFQLVSSHLGNKSASQVRLRFLDLMRLFYSASKDRPIRRQESPPNRRADQSQSPMQC